MPRSWYRVPVWHRMASMKAIYCLSVLGSLLAAPMWAAAPVRDCAALAKTVSDFSQIAYIDSIAEAEINPLIVKREGAGVVAVDGLIVQG